MATLMDKVVDHYLVDAEMLESATHASSRGKILGRLGQAYGARPGSEAWYKGLEIAQALEWNGKDVVNLRSTIQDLLEEYEKAGALDAP